MRGRFADEAGDNVVKFDIIELRHKSHLDTIVSIDLNTIVSIVSIDLN